MVAIGSVDPATRNEQFEFIRAERARFAALGLPVLSIDTKKKEFLGGLYREGALYSRGPLKRYDHDFPYLAEGRVVPHGIYDLRANQGFLTLGMSAETPRFVADSLKLWWDYRGRYDYPDAGTILALFDSGGANSARGHQFKIEMLRLAACTGRVWQVAHYPPYCSKWNPIEHRFFPHVTRAIQGIYLDSVQTVKRCIERGARTSTGLRTRAYILERDYQRGDKTAETLPEGKPLVFHDRLPSWNYSCHPSDDYRNLTYLN